MARGVRLFVGLAVFCTFCLQFFVCLDIGWSFIKDRYSKNAKLANYITRTVLVVSSGKLKLFNYFFFHTLQFNKYNLLFIYSTFGNCCASNSTTYRSSWCILFLNFGIIGTSIFGINNLLGN